MKTTDDLWLDLAVRLRRFVGRRVSDVHAADDITQEVLVKVRLKGIDPSGQEHGSAWIFRVARNAIIDHYRRRRRDPANPPGGEHAADTAEAPRQAEVRGLGACLMQVLEHLPAPYRQAMELADLQGLDQQEIADRQGISLSGAKSRVQRARQQLREMLLDCCRVDRDVRGNVLSYQPTERSSHYCGDPRHPQCGC